MKFQSQTLMQRNSHFSSVEAGLKDDCDILSEYIMRYIVCIRQVLISDKFHLI